jgi:predicted aminopeptidase
MTIQKIIRLLFIISLFFLNGCSHMAYYSQAIGGQWEIFTRSQTIENLLTDSETSPPLKQQLASILKMRHFATEILHLPDNGSYTHYADLERPYVVWSVFATPQFAFTPKLWCFPIVGCVSYRGYFSEAPAQALAETLRTEGYDVYVAGIPAYSSLGWFSDPVLNTMLAWPTYQIAGIIFHELAHQKLYIQDDTSFNEAFAMTVEEVGIERWMAQNGTPEEMAAYQTSQKRHQAFVDLILKTRHELETLYEEQEEGGNRLQAAKTEAFEKLLQDYAELKKQWGGYSGYDNWFAKDLNNAKLLSVVTYQNEVPAFKAMLAEENQDLQRFYERVAQIGALDKEERYRELELSLSRATRD